MFVSKYSYKGKQTVKNQHIITASNMYYFKYIVFITYELAVVVVEAEVLEELPLSLETMAEVRAVVMLFPRVT